VGSGTAAALAHAGIVGAQVAGRSDSEGVLAMPQLASVRGSEVGLVTAPGGRGLIAPALATRGARVCRADVYRRLPPRFDVRHRRRLQALLATPAPRALLLTSLESLQHLLAGLDADAVRLLRTCVVVAASPRLADAARAHGATVVLQAGSASPAGLVAALAAHVEPSATAGPAHAGCGAIR
jgi:uroporphyrinogen-III synthase